MSNIDAATDELVTRWSGLLDEIGKSQAALKELKATAKDEGFNLKCVSQVVKERRKGAKYQVDQLMFELEVNTYRTSSGLPTTVADAQERAVNEAMQ